MGGNDEPKQENGEQQPKKLTKKQLRILEKQRKAEEEAKAMAAGDPSLYGDAPLIQSQELTDRVWHE